MGRDIEGGARGNEGQEVRKCRELNGRAENVGGEWNRG